MQAQRVEKLFERLTPSKQKVAVVFLRLLQKSDPKQLYFWTPTWQRWEREADEDIRKGRIKGPFTTAEDAIKSLET